MLVALLGYLLGHLLIYVLVVRHLAWSRREAAMLLFHVIPAGIAAAWVLGLLLVDPTINRLNEAAAAISLQGIYSLSFLELWSLTQGGYSLHMLSRFCAAGGMVSAADLSFLKGVGAGKRAERLSGLLHLRLIREESDRFGLTRRGRLVAALLGCVSWVVNHKHLG